MNLCVDVPSRKAAPKKDCDKNRDHAAKEANFFLSPIKYFAEKGVDLKSIVTAADIKSVVSAIKPAMPPEIAKATTQLMGLASAMGVDLSKSNPMIADIQAALKEGVKGYLSVKQEVADEL